MEKKRHALKKPLVWGGGGLFLVLVLAYLFVPRPAPADFATVDRGDVAVTVEGEGKTRVREAYMVSAPIAGQLERIRLESGDKVTAEQTVLAQIVPAAPLFLDARSAAEAEAAVKAAQASVSLARAKVERAEADFEFTKSELARANELSAKGNISARGLERSEIDVRMKRAELDTARSDLGVAMSQLASARARLIQPSEKKPDTEKKTGKDKVPVDGCCVAVRSPVSGEVLTVTDKSARVVAAGDPLVEVGDPRDIEVVIDMLSTDAVKVRPGDAALIEHWGGDEDLHATVDRVEPSGFTKISALGIEEQRVNVILEFTGDEAARASLGHGYRVEARIIVDEAKNAIRAPISALFRQGADWNVFVVEGGDAVLRPVTVGRRNDHYAEITKGLNVGETVILHPSNSIEDGTSVKKR